MQSQQILKFFERKFFQSHENHRLTIQTNKQDQLIPPAEATETCHLSHYVIQNTQNETQTDKNRKTNNFFSAKNRRRSH